MGANYSDSCRIYQTVEADETLPIHPGQGWTRFVLMSDTHSRTWFGVPDGDVFIHGGDLSSWGEVSQLKPTIDWLKSLPHSKKIIVAGNHDFCLDRRCVDEGLTLLEDHLDARAMIIAPETVRAGIIYLENEAMELELPGGRVWKVFGSPVKMLRVRLVSLIQLSESHLPCMVAGLFSIGKGNMRKVGFPWNGSAALTGNRTDVWRSIPEDTQILITHTPPYRVLDLTRRGINAGCESLLERMIKLKDLRLHVFGHIHEAAGHTALTGPNKKAIAVNAATPHGRLPIHVIDLRQ